MHHIGASAVQPGARQFFRLREDFMVKLTAFQRTIAHLFIPVLLAWFLHKFRQECCH
jgi:hypothetical protein